VVWDKGLNANVRFTSRAISRNITIPSIPQSDGLDILGLRQALENCQRSQLRFSAAVLAAAHGLSRGAGRRVLWSFVSNS
jgi:hypothetical protein